MFTRAQRLFIGTITVSTLMAFASCSSGGSAGSGGSGGDGKPQTGGSLTVTIPDSFDGWNPDAGVQVASYQLVREVEAPLLEVSLDGQEIAPGLAQKWSYDSTGRKLTLTLQPDAAFSDGKPVTPRDVVFSVQQWLKGVQYGSLYSTFIKSARPAGTRQIVITLTAPSSALLGLMTWSSAAVIPADFGGRSPKEFYAKPVGAGPFAIKSTSADKVELVRNEHYWSPNKPYLDSLTYRVVDDTTQRLLQLQSGDAGMADRVPLDNLSTVDTDSRVVTVPSSSMSLITFAQSAAPMNDPHFRKAVSLAIDRNALAESVYDGKAEVPKGVLPPRIPGAAGCPSCDWKKFDPAAAKAELAHARNADKTVELLVDSARGIDLLAAQAIEPMLEKVGIQVQIKQVDSATLLTRLTSGDYQMTIGNYFAQAPTPVDPLSFIVATGYLFTGADTRGAQAAIAGVSGSADPRAQAAAVAAFEKQNYDSSTVVPVVSPHIASVTGRTTHGLKLYPSGLYDATALWVSK